MTDPDAAVPVLRARTRAVAAEASLLPLLDARRPLLFMRRGEGVAGAGEALRLTFRGPDRIAQAAETWRRIARAASVENPVGLSGSGLVAFGAFTFAAESAYESVLIVPRTIVGRRDGVTWVTDVAVDGEAEGDARVPAATPLGAEFRLGLHPGEVSPGRFREIVAEAVARIRAGDVRKVVVARDLAGHLPEGADLRRVLVDLALGYPDTWTFAVDGHIGSSPETLVRVNHGRVSARVLAGSIARGVDAEADHAAAVALATSTKDLDEHGYAVQSVLAALEPHVRGRREALATSEFPFALKLPNLWHLATNIDGILGDGSSALDLAAAMHPTAAVAGTPTEAALATIAELEGLDRGRYGGPVGWVDADGDGKWAVSVRSAEVHPDGAIRAFAGGGILAASDPDEELAETSLKFRPITEAFA